MQNNFGYNIIQNKRKTNRILCNLGIKDFIITQIVLLEYIKFLLTHCLCRNCTPIVYIEQYWIYKTHHSIISTCIGTYIITNSIWLHVPHIYIHLPVPVTIHQPTHRIPASVEFWSEHTLLISPVRHLRPKPQAATRAFVHWITLKFIIFNAQQTTWCDDATLPQTNTHTYTHAVSFEHIHNISDAATTTQCYIRLAAMLSWYVVVWKEGECLH